ncbi:MAG: ABC transporter permease, partial [Oscillospiraceae bacterium]|nr:ABC transporter permease [Oscillospiraceae bacterium]
MRNPLRKRLPRELLHEGGKYAVIFVFLFGMIALVSGFLVASDSMVTAYNESFEKYNIEDGNLEFSAKPDAEILAQFEEAGDLKLYENYYKEEPTAGIDSTLRLFRPRTDIDRVCLMEGEFAATDSEITIDRMYADNNELHVGDTLTLCGKAFHITGLVALSDYSALYQSPTDMMFDAVKFGVGIVTEDAFDALRDTHLHYSYSWEYNHKPADDIAAKEKADDFLEDIKDILTDRAEEQAKTAEEEITAMVMRGEDPETYEMPEILTIENFIPEYCNQAIIFTGDDLGSDQMMFIVFLYIIVAIIAFVFAVTTANTLTKEANVIGTLRASGYTRGEMLRHYMTVPVVVTLLAAACGNIVGYAFFVKPMADMYYNSYSLPTFVTLWNASAFLKTTVIPVILMILINFLVLQSKMKISPINFLRGNLNPNRKKKSFRLHTAIPIMTRYRLRIIFQNIPNYITMFLGIFLGNIILLFGMALGPFLIHYGDTIADNMIASHQYVLKSTEDIEDETIEDAERYLMTNLETVSDFRQPENAIFYGMEDDSEFVKLDWDDSKVWISSAYSEKFRVQTGETIECKEKYGNKHYTFTVAGVYDYPASIAVFMSEDQFRDVFDWEDDEFTGYFSDKELDDLDEDNIATVITADDLTKTSRQLLVSLGGAATLIKGFSMVIFILMIYLLSKIIIEKNSQAISMTKILGYSGGEISGLYIAATSLIAILSIAATIPLSSLMIGRIMQEAMAAYPGWMKFYV